MKIKIKILATLLTLGLFYGCITDDNLTDELCTTTGTVQAQAQVVLSISVPEVSVPSSSTRVITDDNAINKFVIWAFDNNNRFMYELTQDSRDEKGNLKVVKHGNNVYALLPKSDTNVTLALIANYQTISTPSVGTSIETAEKSLKFTFSENLEYIPMYGKSNPFIVEEGAKPGNISLKRALAKIEIDASHAWPNFDMKSVSIINVNTEGTIVQSETITNSATRSTYKTAINNSNDTSDSNNKWVFYIPEATDIKDGTRISLILEGVNLKDGDGKTRYYRLDFIKRAQSAGEEITYDYISSIERNKRYAFKIEHVIAGTGSNTYAEAVSKDRADNAIINTNLMIIDDEEIRDITTDNEFYLGITSPELKATTNEGSPYYTVNMSVMSNNPNGWKIEDLPNGVEVTIDQYSGDIEIATSVWIYIDKNKYSGAKSLNIYIYSGNIRKTVKIELP